MINMINKLTNLSNYLESKGFSKKANDVNVIIKESFLSTMILSLLTGCKTGEPSPPGTEKLFELHKADEVSEDEMIGYSLGQEVDFDWLIKAASNGNVYSDMELGQSYMHERPIYNEVEQQGELKFAKVKCQFSCIPMGTKVYYVLDGNKKIIFDENSPIPTTYNYTEDNSNYVSNGFDSSGNQDLARLGKPTDTMAFFLDFTIVYLPGSNKELFVFNDGIILNHDFLQSEVCKKDFLPETKDRVLNINQETIFD